MTRVKMRPARLIARAVGMAAIVGIAVYVLVVARASIGNADPDRGPAFTSLVSAPGMKLRQAGDYAPLLIEGERLDFEITYGGIPAGNASLEVQGIETPRGEVLRITSRARSNDVISVFFKVDDRLIAEVDPSTLESMYFEKRLREGPFKKDEWATYGHGED
jgi:hypothetical protein